MLKHKRVFLPLCLVLVFALLSISAFAVASSNPTPDPDPDAFYITEDTTYGDVLEHFYLGGEERKTIRYSPWDPFLPLILSPLL